MDQIYLVHLAYVVGYSILWCLKYLLFFSFVVAIMYSLIIILSLLLDKIGIDVIDKNAKLRVAIMIFSFIVGIIIMRLLFSLIGVKVF